MTSDHMRDEQELREEDQDQADPVVRDRRRVDPETGAVREPAEAEAPAPATPPEPGSDSASASGQPEDWAQEESGESGDQVASLQAQLAEAMADLQRVQAEYANYRKRVDRDRAATREQALANVLGDLLPVLDDIGRAREHGELHGGFRQVGESLEQIASQLGLVSFGEAGDPFDPTIHEALMHDYSSDFTETTCSQILQPGYAVNERVLRPARVAVVEPEAPAQHSPDDQAEAAYPAGSSAEDETTGSSAEDDTRES